jgi:dTDP-4-dehydrorhamnose reductase
MRVLLFGGNGQVGHALQSLSLARGEWIPVTRRDCDLTSAADIRECIERVRPDAIVNAAAYTAVDKAENDRETCYLVNATAPGVMAMAAARIGARLVHYSTDYVFDGTKTSPYLEDDATGPRNVYGASKLAGEQAILDTSADALILRTSWVYSNHGANFLKTMLRLGAERTELRVVADQRGAPTSAEAIAAATIRILEQADGEQAIGEQAVGDRAAGGRWCAGVHHMTAAGETTWYDFAKAIFARSDARAPKLVPITTAEYPTPAARPLYSVLSNEKFARSFGFRLPDWEQQLDAVMNVREVAG